MDTKNFIKLTEDHKIVPVFFNENSDVVIKTIQASYNGGVRIFEFVNRGTNGLETFKKVSKHFSDLTDLILGVGTIYDSQTAQTFIESGAQFIVSPGLVIELGEYCKESNIAYIPGVATITETITAMHLGCEMIKIFPANVIGSAFAKAVKSVMPHLAIMPTGGVEPTSDSMGEWFNAGVNCVGMGSQLFDKKKISSGDFEGLEKDISIAVEVAKTINM
ncbi:2-dehydro-3-deoxyphosphogluconate aldolase/(4S)-4-hydroxy-2-oxoglutarate aldolase [Nonlabens xylanidelens]|uniref:2-dehydro-3-deoxyphosphogluconate aldolase/(4S)-4-hydroxy-2-oxoglutarate aldolase n=1 Tax=Nonlabens xylanidelens TaxID=191564 RepID=A0A2S6IJR0_9FLAO|nr:bifunctional 4-hydroxy-2-oxoglutarate aldolase/2-dehydro-3-deoxy-phosphogluconate aldolase [Nonlabens xylanidelens]PPK94438.1 2-dehydro-3-deoxyphosphogluconate aldolase/(4S)-4-hydroxy-2-oxoglutarate aldolase [Nonlabens xylanidelens]PQJ21403.1 bifunctional 4-hydroxy-2-oxoglutarate aldolase/2-dehydro-3-deoxy-phosphogluconate aldolase [Nonlabens xylanidelens]